MLGHIDFTKFKKSSATQMPQAKFGTLKAREGLPLAQQAPAANLLLVSFVIRFKESFFFHRFFVVNTKG